MALRQVFSLALIGLLAGCGGKGELSGRDQITPEFLAGVDQSLMLLELPRFGVSATAIPVAQNGDVQTWTTGDNRTFSFRDGVVTATRGTAYDLMSARVSGAVEASRGRAGPGAYETFHSTLDGFNQVQFRTLSCRVTGRRSETITIFGQRRAVHRTDELCHAPGTEIENTYWRGRDGLMWKSKQWVGPEIGYVITERLVR